MNYLLQFGRSMFSKRTVFFGALVVSAVVCAGSAQAETEGPKPAATKSKTAAKTTAATPARRPLYSAERSLTRQAKLARARAAAEAREIARTPLPRYKTDASGDVVPDVRAAAAIIYDPVTGKVLWEENSQDQRSIASITKLMTAVVFMETNPDLDQEVVMARSDVFQASTTHLRANDHVTTDELLHLLLISSDNAAARALARVSPYGSEGFIVRMNEKAADLGLTATHYADPSGLLAGKTGFIRAAGYCLATLLRLPASNQQVAVVVLGARSNAGRFMETQNLFDWLSEKASTLFATSTKTPVAVAVPDPAVA